jgi:hypothetical protein
MKSQVVLLLLAVVALTGMAFADQVVIQENTGNDRITFTGVTPGTDVHVSIDATTVGTVSSINGVVPGTDSAFNAPISGLTFDYTNTGTFSPTTQTITVGNSSSGILSGTVTYVSLTSNGSGGFSLNIGLNGLTFANCSTGGCTNSALLSAFGTAGNGILTFQFVSGTGPQGINDLLNLPAGTAAFTTFSGTLANVPEPATLAMFGSGLLALVGTIRRRMVR